METTYNIKLSHEEIDAMDDATLKKHGGIRITAKALMKKSDAVFKKIYTNPNHSIHGIGYEMIEITKRVKALGLENYWWGEAFSQRNNCMR